MHREFIREEELDSALRRGLDEACKTAARSPFKRHRTGAVLMDRSGRVISRGWSHTPQTPLRELWSMHAEFHAALRMPPWRKWCVCFIATLTEHDNTTLARPCVQCAVQLSHVGVEYCVYTPQFPYKGAEVLWLEEPPALEELLKKYPSRSEVLKRGASTSDSRRHVRSSVA